MHKTDKDQTGVKTDHAEKSIKTSVANLCFQRPSSDFWNSTALFDFFEFWKQIFLTLDVLTILEF